MEDKRRILKTRQEVLEEAISKVTDEKLTWPEIKRRIDQGDIIYIIAFNIAKRKVEEIENRNHTKTAHKYLSLFNATSLIAHTLLFIYMALSIFQKPSWCRGPVPLSDGEEGDAYLENCSGTVKQGQVIPVSDVHYLQNWQVVLIEVICVTLLTARRYIKQIVKKQTSHRLFQIAAVLTVLVYLSDLVQYGFGVLFPFNQFIRPFYFIFYNKDVRTNIRFYLKIVWKCKEIFIAVTTIFWFFVCLAKIIFYQTSQNQTGPITFDTFWNTAYNLFVQLTTANYPDVMMPIFVNARVSSLFFITFMVVMYFILLKIILAYFYKNYKDELIKEARTFQRMSTKALMSLFEDELDDENIPGIGDSPKDSLISKADSTWLREELKKQYTREISNKAGWRRILYATMELPSVKMTFGIGNLLAFILLIIQSCFVNPHPMERITEEQLNFGIEFNTQWMAFVLALNSFLLLEPIARISALGWKYIKSMWFRVFELLLSLLIMVLTIITLTVDGFSIDYLRIVLILRIFSFFKWVISLEKYHNIYQTFIKLVPLFLDVLAVLSVAFYLYSTTGEVLFGGHLKTNLPINFAEYGDPNYFVYVNFNDFANGLYTCVHLLVVNNWLYTIDVHCRTMRNFAYRWFFVSFFIIAVVICLNILIALILDLYLTQMASKEKKNPIQMQVQSVNMMVP